MLTQCPECGAVFRLQAEHLRTAHGFVECGDCGHVFNALQRLADEPPPAASEGPYIGEEAVEMILVAEGAPPMWSTADPEDLDLPRIAPDAGDLQFDALRLKREDGATEAVAGAPQRLDAIEHAILFTAPDGSDEATPAGMPGKDEFDLDGVPAILRDDIARLAGRERSRSAWIWGCACALLLSALGAQIAWAFREPIFARYAQTRPYALRICAVLGCELETKLDSRSIELVARDVRDHPQYERTLLVNATLANRGERPAAYPVIQLGIYDRTGAVVGIRRFRPDDYLDRSIDIAAGMPAGRTVYIVMEIAGAGDMADSFEFTFL